MPLSKPRRAPTAVQLMLDALEDRTVPTIVITGTPGDDVIRSQITPVPGSTQYQADILLNGAAVASWVGDTWPYPDVSVFAPEPIEVDGLDGNDDIDLGQIRDPEGVFAPIVVHGGNGNDTIKGSYGQDQIYGDAGADSLNGGIDEDTIYADTSAASKLNFRV